MVAAPREEGLRLQAINLYCNARFICRNAMVGSPDKSKADPNWRDPVIMEGRGNEAWLEIGASLL